jgi:hypothetical protein
MEEVQMDELDFKRVGPPKQSYMTDQQTHAESMSVIAEKVDEIESLKQQLAEAQEQLDLQIPKQALGQLKQQLVESQAVNVKLRDHIMLALEFCDLPAFSIAENLENALAIPSDTTALNELITKAGEVMRERCLSLREAHLVRSEEIRAIPGVTLEDLK